MSDCTVVKTFRQCTLPTVDTPFIKWIHISENIAWFDNRENIWSIVHFSENIAQA